jgi:hypothetical protein
MSIFYLKISLVFIFSFLTCLVLSLNIIKISHNSKQIIKIERKLLSKLTGIYKFIYKFMPSISYKLIFKKNQKNIEYGLLNLLENITNNLSSGLSLKELIKENLLKINQDLQNKIYFFFILNKKTNTVFSLKTMKDNEKNIFLKIFWLIVLSYYKNGSKVLNCFKSLLYILESKIKIKENIDTELLQTKIQAIISVTIPYLVFFVMFLLYPNFITPVIKSTLGKKILLIAFLMHLSGSLIFLKMVKFNLKDYITYSMFLNYVSFSLKSGKPILASVKELIGFNILKKEDEDIIKNLKSTSEFYKKLLNSKDKNLLDFLNHTQRQAKFGTPIAESLEKKSIELIRKLNLKAKRFQKKVVLKSMIPIFLFIFPSTYIIILSGVIVEIFGSTL